jgi:nitrate reductase gamma subunit
MHWGIYLLLLWIALLFAAYFVPSAAVLAKIIGIIAFALGTIGAVGLILKRTTNRHLALYTAPVDYFNLVFLVAIFGLGLISWLMDPQLDGHQAYVGSLLTFKPTQVPLVVLSMFLLLQIFTVYMPFSKLIHYIIKHFTFTELLWDDEFKTKGSNEDQLIRGQLSYRVTWGGPHFAGGKSWLEEIQGGSQEGESS